MIELGKAISIGKGSSSEKRIRMKRSVYLEDELQNNISSLEGSKPQLIIKPNIADQNFAELLGNVYNAAKIPLSNLKTLIEIFTDEPELFTKQSLLNLFRNIKPSVLDLYNLMDTLSLKMDYNPDLQKVNTDLGKFLLNIKGVLSETAREKNILILINKFNSRNVLIDRAMIEKFILSLLITLIRLSNKNSSIEINYRLVKNRNPKLLFYFETGVELKSDWFETPKASTINSGSVDEAHIMLLLELKVLKEIIKQCNGDLYIQQKDKINSIELFIP